MKKLLIASTLLAGMNSYAHAADVPVQEVVVVPNVFTWSGVYIGVNVGGAWGDNNADSNAPGAAGFSPDQKFNHGSALGGAQIGYNWQFNQFVIGAEADINALDLGGDSDEITDGVGDFYHTKHDWFGTVRGRAGYAWDRTLIYATGGFAYGRVKEEYIDPILGTFSSSSTKSGWTVGGGVEYAFTDNWTVRGEYLYVHLDEHTLSAPVVDDVTFENKFNVVRLGVNYKF
jgi:outer membrane immunogenic protein